MPHPSIPTWMCVCRWEIHLSCLCLVSFGKCTTVGCFALLCFACGKTAPLSTHKQEARFEPASLTCLLTYSVFHRFLPVITGHFFWKSTLPPPLPLACSRSMRPLGFPYCGGLFPLRYCTRAQSASQFWPPGVAESRIRTHVGRDLVSTADECSFHYATLLRFIYNRTLLYNYLNKIHIQAHHWKT